jgi:hypothetical protein
MPETTTPAKTEKQPKDATKEAPESSEGVENIDGSEIVTTHGEPPDTPDINEAGEAELARRGEASPKAS